MKIYERETKQFAAAIVGFGSICGFALVAGCSDKNAAEKAEATASSPNATETALSTAPSSAASALPSPTASATTNAAAAVPEASPSPSPSPTASAPSAPSAVSTRYSIKVEMHPYVPTEFSLKLNGSTIGEFNANANQDITDDVKPGKNVLSVAWRHIGPATNQFSESKVILGVQKNGAWSTVANQAVGMKTKDGQRSMTFTAK